MRLKGLRRQIAELKSKHADLDFENLLRITPVGAISIIVGPTCSDGWNWYDTDRVQHDETHEGVLLARREAERDHRVYRESHPGHEQLRTSSHFASGQACVNRRISNSGAPAVSQRWASLEHVPAEELSEEQALLLKTVQAEDIFLSVGKGIRESMKLLA